MCELVELPELGALHRLRCARLGGNRLKALPSLHNLQALEVLELDGNQLASVDLELPKLRLLGLARNLLRHLELRGPLEELRLAGNRLPKLQTIERLKGLKVLLSIRGESKQELQCHANPLRPLPADFGHLQKLCRLQVGRKWYSTVACRPRAACWTPYRPVPSYKASRMCEMKGFGELVNLEHCDVARNQLRSS